MNIELFTAFLLITVVLIIAPGPIVTLIISTGVMRGGRAALITVAGTTLGNALLLAAIASRSAGCTPTPTSCSPRCAGPARPISSGSESRRGGTRARAARLMETGRARFVRGILVALSNPKTIVFFTAFLPQFIDPRLPAGPQLAAMCVATVVLAGVSDCAWAVAAGMGRAWFMKPERAKLLGRLSGTVLIGGGVWLSLARRTN